MINERTLSTGVRVVLGRDDRIVWASDWRRIWEVPEVFHVMYPNSYCHTEYFLRAGGVTISATVGAVGSDGADA